MRILLLTDRDWTHPQGGGSGTDLYGQVTRWLALGHRVTVIAGSYPGARAVERPADGLTIHRMGTRMTVVPRAAWATLRGIGRDADVVLEVVGGIAFRSPAWWWLDAPTFVADPARREGLGEAAQARARGFGLNRTAEENLSILQQAAAGARPSLRAELRRSETAKAAGMALATLAMNALAIVATVVFTRLLGVADYGSLGSLLSTFTILAVAGSALQLAVARETALGHVGDGESVGASVRRWLGRLAVAGVALTAASVILREELARLIAVPDQAWAAAAIVPTGVLWLALGVLRGALQGLHGYAPVAASIVLEALGRLVLGVGLVLGGAGVTGAFLGTPLSMLVAGSVLLVVLRRRVGPVAAAALARTRSMRSLVSGGWAPIVGRVFLAALQNVDVVVAKREMGDDAAGAYAAAVVAAKLMVWVAIGIGLYLLPEATRRAAAGLDPRPVFVRTLALLALVAMPALLIFAVAPALLLRLAFGPEFAAAADALVVLGAAMTLLAIAYLAVQYMLALRETAFLWPLGVVAVAEPVLLSLADVGLVPFASVVLGLQCAAATGALGLALRPRRGLATA